jgi:hypothetical protein
MMHRLAALTVATSLTGCSFFLTSSPPDRTNPPSVIPPDCTSQMTWPTIDAIIAIASLIGVVGAATQGNTSSSSAESSRGSAIVSSLLLGGLAGAGAYVGHGRVRSCRFAQTEFNAAFYRNGGVPGQPPFAPGGPGSGPNSGYADAPDGTPQQPRAYVPQGSYAPPPARPLAAEGDVCNAEVVCGLGLVCASNLCVVPPKKRP